ncbi:MAG: glycosyltransferase family 25 protein [Myxococcota bacterium]
MRLIDYFGRAYIINLAHRIDRMVELGDELARIGLDPHDPRFVRFDACQPEDRAGFPSLGAHGCFMSHLGLLRKARAEGLERVWILEDDVSFDPWLPQYEARIVGQLEAQPDWGLVYIGYGNETRRNAGHRTPTLRRTDEPLMCSHCMGVNRRMFDPLIAYLEACLQRPAGHPEGGPMHVDGAYSMFRQLHDDAVTLIVDPSLAGQRASRTDIHELGLLDRLPMTRALMGELRRVKNALQTTPSLRAVAALVGLGQ